MQQDFTDLRQIHLLHLGAEHIPSLQHLQFLTQQEDELHFPLMHLHCALQDFEFLPQQAAVCGHFLVMQACLDFAQALGPLQFMAFFTGAACREVTKIPIIRRATNKTLNLRITCFLSEETPLKKG